MDKTVSELLRERVEVKGLTVTRLKQQTGIAERYLQALLEGNSDRLPASPYVRGYLFRLASILDLDGSALWELYRSETGARSSGPADRLPANRFALRPISRAALIAGVLAVVLLGYFALNANRFLGRPDLRVVSPAAETTVTDSHTITLIGTVDPSDTLTIGGEPVSIEPSGRFERPYELQPGLNQIEFLASRLLGGEAKVIRQVIYQPSQPLPVPLPEQNQL